MEIEVIFEENLKVNAKVGENIVKTDQPKRGGGDGSAASPFELFLSSIATCSGIYVKQFCKSRGIDPKTVKIIQKHTYNPDNKLIDNINIEVQLPEGFPEKYKEPILKAVDQCAVKRHLMNPPKINAEVKE